MYALRLHSTCIISEANNLLKGCIGLEIANLPGPHRISAASDLSSIPLISITSVLNIWIVAEADVFCVSSSVDTLLSSRGGFCSGTEN